MAYGEEERAEAERRDSAAALRRRMELQQKGKARRLDASIVEPGAWERSQTLLSHDSYFQVMLRGGRQRTSRGVIFTWGQKSDIYLGGT